MTDQDVEDIRTSASWNPIVDWLRRLEGLRAAA